MTACKQTAHPVAIKQLPKQLLISQYKVQSTIRTHFAEVQTLARLFQHMLRPLWTLERVSCLSDVTDAAKPHYLIENHCNTQGT